MRRRYVSFSPGFRIEGINRSVNLGKPGYQRHQERVVVLVDLQHFHLLLAAGTAEVVDEVSDVAQVVVEVSGVAQVVVEAFYRFCIFS